MQTNVTDKKLRGSAELILNSSYTVGFSGAGISTESGIPDFRSPACGIWNNVDPLKVASIYGFKNDPQAFYDWVRPLVKTTLDATPNDAHTALVSLEKLGLLKSIITQNIDMLHSQAGSSNVHELHGHMRGGTCIGCYRKFQGDFLLRQLIEESYYLKCPTCRQAIKPDVILFGEQLPYQQFAAAQADARRSDLMIIIGTSLEVAPSSDIPLLAKTTGAKLIIINLEPTYLDQHADIVFHNRAAEILPRIVQQVEKKYDNNSNTR